MSMQNCLVARLGEGRFFKRRSHFFFWFFVLSLLLCARAPSVLATGPHTITIDGNNDFASDEDVPGTSGSTWYFTWDADNFYFAVSATEVASGSATQSVLIYFDVNPQQNPLSGTGSALGQTYGTQAPALPFHADYHFRWKIDNSLAEILAWDGSSWSALSNSGLAAAPNADFVEFKLPRVNLGNPAALYVCGAMIDEQGGIENTFAMTPQSNGPDGFDSDFAHFYGFALVEGVAPDFAGNEDAYPVASVVSGSFTSGATWTGGLVPDGNSNVFIQGGHAVTLDGDAGVRHLTIAANGTFSGGHAVLQLASGGVFINNGIFNAEAGTIAFLGTGTISGSLAFNDITINSGVDFGSNASVRGTLQINAGGFVNINAPAYEDASTLKYSTGGSYTVGSEWTANAATIPGVPYHVTIDNATTLEMLSADRTMRGSLAIASNSTLNATSGNIFAGGDWVNDGNFNHNSGSVVFEGSGLQTITGSAATDFNALTVNMSGGGVLETLAPITMASNGLTLTQGTFKISSASTLTPFSGSETIPAGAGFYLNHPAAVSNWGSSGSLTLGGSLVLDAGLMNMGSGSGNQLSLSSSTSEATINGGTLNVAGRLNVTGSGAGNGLTINGGEIVVSTVGNGSGTVAGFNISATGKLTMAGGTVTIERANTSTGSDVVIASGSGAKTVSAGTFQFGNAATPAAQVMKLNSGIPLFHCLIDNDNATVQLTANSLTLNGDLNINAGTLDANNLDLYLAGSWANNGTFIPGAGTVFLDGALTQNLSEPGFNNLTINNAAGATLLKEVTVSGILALNGGIINTGPNKVVIPSGGTIARTSGYIEGDLQKYIPSASNIEQTFEIGAGGEYSPAVLNIAAATNPGNLAAHVLAGDHPELASSQLDPGKSVNRYWTITADGSLALSAYEATFSFPETDLDGSAQASSLLVGKFDGSNWSYPAVGSRTPTSTQALSLDSFGEFQLAECVPPQVSISGDDPVTAGANYLYTAQTNALAPSFIWSVTNGSINGSNTNGTASITAGANGAMVVNLLLTETSTGCSNTAERNIAIVTTSTLTTNAGADQAVCGGFPVVLGGDPAASGGSMPYAYSWSPSTGLSATTEPHPTATPLATTTYTLTVTDANQQTATAEVVVTVRPLPVVSFEPVTALCLNDAPVDLAQSVNPQGGVFSGPGISGTTFSPAVAGIGTHLVTYAFTDANGCSNSTAQEIVVATEPVLTFTPPTSFCTNAPAFDLSSTASPASGSFSGPGIQGNNFDPATAGAGTHTVTYTFTTNGGCTSSASQALVVHDAPRADAGSDQSIASGQTVPLGGHPTASSGTPPYLYSWSPGSGLDDPTSANPGATVTATTTYSVTIVDGEGCSATDEVTINVQSLDIDDFVLLADEDIDIDRNEASSSQGNVHSNGKLTFGRGEPTTFTGNLTAVGDVFIDKRNVIAGNVTAGGAILLAYSAKITGTQSDHAAVSALPITANSFTAGGRNYTVFKKRGLTLEPGEYGRVLVGKEATLRLQSGEYYFTQLEMQKEAELAIDVTAGPVSINVESSLEIGEECFVHLQPGDEQSSAQVVFTTLQNTRMQIEEEAYVVGTLLAPYAEAVLGKHSSFRGALRARRIQVEHDVTFLHHSSSGHLPFPKPAVEQDLAAANESAVENYALEPNYPNPFNPQTTLHFRLPVAGYVTVKVFDVTGQMVRELFAGEKPAGRHQIIWDGKGGHGELLASGIYVCVYQAGGFTAQRKLLLLK